MKYKDYYATLGVARDAKTEFLKQWGVTNIVEVEDDKLNPGKLTLNRKEAQKIDLWIASVATAKRVAAQAKVSDIKLVYTVRGDDKGTIAGEDFNRALLRIWLGEQPADASLKKAMLGG